MENKTDMVSYLLSKGADPTTGASAGIATPLHWAAYAGDLALVKRLLSTKMDSSSCLQARSSKYRYSTPLHRAAITGDAPTVEYLISRGADVNARCIDNSTPLHWAACHRNTGILELIKAKADVEAVANDGSTPLHWASFHGAAFPMTFLMINGADKNTRTCDGYNTIEVSDWAFDPQNLECMAHHKVSGDAKVKDKDRFHPPFWKF